MSLIDGRRGGLVLAAAAVVGAIVLVLGLLGQDPEPPELPAAGVGALETEAPRPDRPTDSSRNGAGGEQARGSGVPEVEPADDKPLPASEPVSIEIPAIGVESEVFRIGLAPDGSLAVPQPGPRLDLAAWFENSPTPGQPGPSIIEGHVATAEGGPSVFFELADLRPGDEIKVRREDDRVVTFTVRALREFDKDEFPTRLVYGGDLGTPSLRLITCSNFDPATGSHEGNLIVFSELTDVSRA